MIYAVKTSKDDGICVILFNVVYNFAQKLLKHLKTVWQCLNDDFITGCTNLCYMRLRCPSNQLLVILVSFSLQTTYTKNIEYLIKIINRLQELGNYYTITNRYIECSLFQINIIKCRYISRNNNNRTFTQILNC